MKPRFQSISSLRRVLQTPHLDVEHRAQTLELLRSLSGQLAGAPLRGVRLSNLDLRGIDLRGVILTGARIYDADLRGADLRGADLRRAWLCDVLVRGTRLSGARLQGTTFVRVDLHRTQLGQQPGLSLLGARDCYVCGSDGDAPCVDLKTGAWMPLLHPQRWTRHNLILRRGKFFCTSCGGLWSQEPKPRKQGTVDRRHQMCPNVPLFFSWAAVPDWLVARPRMRQLGIPIDDTVDAFVERRGGRVPLFDLHRLVG